MALVLLLVRRTSRPGLHRILYVFWLKSLIHFPKVRILGLLGCRTLELLILHGRVNVSSARNPFLG